MTEGVGIDIADVERVAQRIEKENGFKEMIFSVDEISYCESKANKFEHYAARFAAKEAFFKAIGTGWANGTAFNEVEVVNDANGKPGINFIGETNVTVGLMQIINILVSLTHIKMAASAV